MTFKSALITSLLTMGVVVSSAHAEVQTIHDVLDRNVQVDVPAKRVVLGFYAEDYMAIGGEQAFDHVVGLSRDTWKVWRPTSWQLYTEHDPKLAQIPDVGEVEAQTFSIEKVLSLRPDVVVLADWQYQGLGVDVKRLEQANIPVVVVDYNAQTRQRHIKSTQIIGQLTGQNKRADEIVTGYSHAMDLIETRIKEAKLPKPKAYVEFGNKGPSQYSFTYGKNMWGAMLEQVHADNIAAPYVKWWGPINPEQVLAAKPEVIFIAGTESTKVQGSMLMGEGVKRQDAVDRLKGFTQRAGWSQLPAVKEQRVYGIYQGASRSILDYTMSEYLAKALYPELFKDLKPEQDYLNFYKKYLPVMPQGTFAVSISE